MLPLLTFVRLSDGERRLLDMAALPPEARNALVFQQEGAPWREGCVLPALAVPGLNDDFCPGLTPEGKKKLTVEESLVASHGVYPAHPVKHLVCYRIKPRRTRRLVQVRNQFERRLLGTRFSLSICVPSNKLVLR